MLALTDVSGRAIVETFSRLAADHGVHVTVSTNVAEFERVEGPQAALLGDPEADDSYAYEANSPEVHNRNFLFGPDGELLDIQSKAYLIPIERSRDLGLGMTGVQIDQLAPIDLPFGRLGTVTSKDAWMVDANDRLDQLSATLLVQPEAFSTWAVSGGDLWPPDKFQRSGWLMTQRHPALRANVTPMLTGNFGDMTFDGQPLIAVETPGGTTGLCNLGQRPEPGWAALGRWNAYEGPAQDLCGEHRREEFAERGEAMRPGSGHEHENAYAEDVVFADLDLSLPRPAADRVARGDFAVTEPAPGQASQLVPSVTSTVDGAALTWIDLRRGNSSTYVARFDRGAWGEPALVSDQGVHEHDHFDNQWAPVLGSTREGLVAIFVDFRTENWDLYRSTSSDGSSWSDNERMDDADEVEGTVRERGHSSPAVATLPDGRLISVWSDLRWPFVVPQVRAAVSDDSGSTWSPSVRVDGGTESREDVQPWARHHGEAPGSGQHAPAVTVTGDGGILVAWQDGAGYVPHVRVVRSADGGRSFSAPLQVGDGPGFRPALAADGSDVWLVYERRTDDGGSVIELAHSDDGGAGWSEPVTADHAPPPGITQRDPAIVAADGTIGVVFSDDRAGDEDVLLAVTDGAARQLGQLHRLNEGSDGSHARAPSATLLDDGRVLAVWQEEDGSTVGLRAAIGASASRGRTCGRTHGRATVPAGDRRRSRAGGRVDGRSPLHIIARARRAARPAELPSQRLESGAPPVRPSALITAVLVSLSLAVPASASGDAVLKQSAISARYFDVCGDAGGDALDLRQTIVQRDQEDGQYTFTAVACARWDAAQLDDRRLVWRLTTSAERTFTVAIHRPEGALRITVTETTGGASSQTYDSGETVGRFDGEYGAGGSIPSSAIGDATDLEFRLEVDQAGAIRDRLPEAHEPPANYPESCPQVTTTRTMRVETGGYGQAVAAARAAGYEVSTEIPQLGAFTIRPRPGARVAGLAAIPGVIGSEAPNPVERLEVTPDDPEFDRQWSLPAVRAPQAWTRRTGSGLTVAIADDGVDGTRTDIAGRVLAGRDVHFDVALDGGADSDRGGHGTAVSGILGARGDNATDIAGVDWTARIVPYRLFDAAGCADDIHLAKALVEATDRGVDVINLSVGTVGDSAVLRDAVTYAADHGIVVVAAVGNAALVDNEAVYPASYPSVIGVGATLRDGTIAPYSNTGSGVHLVAPGGDGSGHSDRDLITLGDRGGLVAVGGTSFAAPIVSGGVLLFLADRPEVTPSEVASALAATAVDRGPTGRDDTYGWGLIDLEALLGVSSACPQGEVPDAGFVDVASQNVHRAAIDCVVWWRVARGISDDRYEPGLSVNRAQMASFIAAAIEATGMELSHSGRQYTDTSDTVHADNIDKLAEAGVVTGTGGTSYSPGAPVSRAQMATFLVNAHDLVTGGELSSSGDRFADIAETVHRDNINAAADAGLVQGRTAALYEPGANVRRDQMASFVRNLLQAFVAGDHAEPPSA